MKPTEVVLGRVCCTYASGIRGRWVGGGLLGGGGGDWVGGEDGSGGYHPHPPSYWSKGKYCIIVE